MRKIIVTEFITLDGVIEGPGPMDSFKYAGWSMPYGTPEIMKFKADELFASDALLLGRITYDGFAAAWPKMADHAGEFGVKMNSMPKFVVSRLATTDGSAGKLEWNNSTLVTGNVPEEIMKLKQQPGKDILVCGSSDLIQTLIKNNLIDEYNLLVYPVVLGTGLKLFKEGANPVQKLSLIESRKFDNAVLLLRYSSIV